MGRFSPLFYGKKDQQLPFTDSDGLYDFPSSDGKGNYLLVNNRKTTSGKRKERKSSKSGNWKLFFFNLIFFFSIYSFSSCRVYCDGWRTRFRRRRWRSYNTTNLIKLSPTQGPSTSPNRGGASTTLTLVAGGSQHHNQHNQQLDVPGKEHGHRPHSPPKHSGSRKSPKRRPIQRHNIASSSSSTESLVPSPAKEQLPGRGLGKCELNARLRMKSTLLQCLIMWSVFRHCFMSLFRRLRRHLSHKDNLPHVQQRQHTDHLRLWRRDWRGRSLISEMWRLFAEIRRLIRKGTPSKIDQTLVII